MKTLYESVSILIILVVFCILHQPSVLTYCHVLFFFVLEISGTSASFFKGHIENAHKNMWMENNDQAAQPFVLLGRCVYVSVCV